MKKIILIGIMVLSAVAGFAQNTATVNKLKEQQKVLDLTAKLNKLQLDYEKEKANNIELSKKAAGINADANTATTDFNTSNASSTVKDAKSTIKKLKETEAVNKKLAKSQKSLNNMEKKITKLQSQIDDLNKKIKFVDNQ